MLRSLRLFLVPLFFLIASIAPTRTSAQSPGFQIYECKPGPWGTVAWHYIYLEAPDWIIDQFPPPNPQPAWHFPGMSKEGVRSVMNKAGILTGKVDGWFADPRAISEGPDAITLYPSVADVERLSPSAREILYDELAKSPRNEFHADPFFITDRTIDEWLGKRVVRPEVRRVFDRLTYKRGDILAFSDMSVLASYAKGPEEVRDLMKLCTRVRAIMAYLLVDGRSDLPTMQKYWSANFHRKDLIPLLESVSQLPRGGQLGFAHLLSSQARRLMYTYPTSDLASGGKLPNCHWTTLNFFNYQIDNRFLDLGIATSRVRDGYTKVPPPYTFGDALMFLGKDGNAIHSCNYLCDDLVFTKNGDNLNAPWTISRLGTVQRLYSASGAVSIQGYRRDWGAKD
jgi:hypothetical protein